DLRGSLRSAGRIGGLLALSYSGTNCFAMYDGNGNLVSSANASDARLLVQYEYGPFGESVRSLAKGPNVTPFRWSTKYQDDQTELLYYGYRYLNPSVGCWPGRDPEEEFGGLDLYGFVRNNPIQIYDDLGLSWSILRTGRKRAHASTHDGDTIR